MKNLSKENEGNLENLLRESDFLKKMMTLWGFGLYFHYLIILNMGTEASYSTKKFIVNK